AQHSTRRAERIIANPPRRASSGDSTRTAATGLACGLPLPVRRTGRTCLAEGRHEQITIRDDGRACRRRVRLVVPEAPGRALDAAHAYGLRRGHLQQYAGGAVR